MRPRRLAILRRVAMLGLSFKPGTDDLRESPMAELAEMLIGKGFEVAIYDREVSLARIHGSNRTYIEHVIPHISSLLKGSVEEALVEAEVIVVAKRSQEFQKALAIRPSDKRVIDLAGLLKIDEKGYDGYEGICW